MARPFLLSLLPLFLSLAFSDDSVHSLLRSHGLPAGLLPKTVRSFSLDPATALLTVNLDSPCIAEYDRSPVRFDQQINANLTFGGLKGVRGLTQEELFLWLPIREILVSDPKSGVILLDIGMAHKQMSVSVFENPPDCKEDRGPETITQVGFQEQRETLFHKGAAQVVLTDYTGSSPRLITPATMHDPPRSSLRHLQGCNTSK